MTLRMIQYKISCIDCLLTSVYVPTSD